MTKVTRSKSRTVGSCVAALGLLMLLGGSCKHDPVGPPACDTCSKPCDTCNVQHSDTTSHDFVLTQYSFPSEGILSGVWIFGPNNIYVVGGAVRKFDGVTWKDVSPNSSHGSLSGKLSGSGMFAFSENDYWLVHGVLLFHCVGGFAEEFRTDTLSRTAPLHTIWGSSSKDLFAVGDGGTILHYDGAAWTRMNSGTTKDIGHIWGPSDKNIWAAGWNQTKNVSVLVHYDGVSWQEVNLGEFHDVGTGSNGLIGVWACDSAGHAKTYACGSFVYRKTDSGPWSNDSGLIPNRLPDSTYAGLEIIRGNGPNDFMVAGGSGFLCHWNGESWNLYKSLYVFGLPGHDVSGLAFKDNTVCMVGIDQGHGWVVIGRR